MLLIWLMTRCTNIIVCQNVIWTMRYITLEVWVVGLCDCLFTESDTIYKMSKLTLGPNCQVIEQRTGYRTENKISKLTFGTYYQVIEQRTTGNRWIRFDKCQGFSSTHYIWVVMYWIIRIYYSFNTAMEIAIPKC